MTDVHITIDDLRACGVCKNSKPWLEGHGLSFADLKPQNGGIHVLRLYELDDQGDVIARLEKAAIARLKKEGLNHG